MIYDNVGVIRDPFKQDLALAFCRKKKKYISVLTKAHINHDQIHHQTHVRNIYLGPIFFSSRESVEGTWGLRLHLVL